MPKSFHPPFFFFWCRDSIQHLRQEISKAWAGEDCIASAVGKKSGPETDCPACVAEGWHRAFPSPARRWEAWPSPEGTGLAGSWPFGDSPHFRNATAARVAGLRIFHAGDQLVQALKVPQPAAIAGSSPAEGLRRDPADARSRPGSLPMPRCIPAPRRARVSTSLSRYARGTSARHLARPNRARARAGALKRYAAAGRSSPTERRERTSAAPSPADLDLCRGKTWRSSTRHDDRREP